MKSRPKTIRKPGEPGVGSGVPAKPVKPQGPSEGVKQKVPVALITDPFRDIKIPTPSTSEEWRY